LEISRTAGVGCIDLLGANLTRGFKMPTYKVVKTFKYTEEVEVEANSEREACDLAQDMDGDYNNDDYLYDCDAKEISA
jgi:hypothetical protein